MRRIKIFGGMKNVKMYKMLWGIGFVISLFMCLNINAQVCVCAGGLCLTSPNCSCCPQQPPQPQPSTSNKAKSLKDQANGFIKDGNCNDKCKEEFDAMKKATECVEKTEKCKADTEDYEQKQKECNEAKEERESACKEPSSDACASAREAEQKKCDEAEKAKTAANESCKAAKDSCPGVEGLDGKDGKPPASENVSRAYDQAVSNLNAKLGAYKGCCFAATGKGAFCGIVPPKYSNHPDNDIMFLTALLLPGLALSLLKFFQYIKMKQRI